MTDQPEEIDFTEKRQQFIESSKRVFNSDDGVIVLEGLSEFCEEHKNPYVQGSFDRTANLCGKRAVILFLRKTLKETGLPKQTTVKTESES